MLDNGARNGRLAHTGNSTQPEDTLDVSTLVSQPHLDVIEYSSPRSLEAVGGIIRSFRVESCVFGAGKSME